MIAARPGAVPDWVRESLRRRGFAMRRADAFPGLGPTWIRIAVREPESTACLLDTLSDVLTVLTVLTRPPNGVDHGKTAVMHCR